MGGRGLVPSPLRAHILHEAFSEVRTLAGWSLLCPEIDVSIGPEPVVRSGLQTREREEQERASPRRGAGEGWPGSKPDFPDGAH